MAKKFTRNTPFSEFISDIILKNACVKGVDWTQLSKFKDKTFGEAMDEFLLDKNANQAWASWCLYNYYEDWEKSLREDCMKKIKDSMSAFMLYTNLETISDEEENILKSKFEGKLPTAEKELKDGKIKRKKDKEKDKDKNKDKN